MLNINVDYAGQTAVLHCQGRIVSGDETGLLCAAMAQEPACVTLDLAEVSAIDAAGIGVLVSLQAAGIYLQLLNPTPQVREVLKVTQLDSIFEISESQSNVAQSVVAHSVVAPLIASQTIAAQPNDELEQRVA